MIRPIRNQVLVKPFPSDNVSTGGIIVSDAHKAISNKLEVVEVGNGLPNKPMRFKKGDTVFRVQDTGTEIMYKGELHFLLPQEYIIATA